MALVPPSRETWLKNTTEFFERLSPYLIGRDVTLESVDPNDLYHISAKCKFDPQLRCILETIYAKDGPARVRQCGVYKSHSEFFRYFKPRFALTPVPPTIEEKAGDADVKAEPSLDLEDWVELGFDKEEKDEWRRI